MEVFIEEGFLSYDDLGFMGPTEMAELSGLTEDEAFKRLRRTAMDRRQPLVEIARAVLVSESLAPGLPAK